MARDVTFGIRLPNSGPLASPTDIRAIALLSERCGFDTVWVHDHISWPSHRRTHFAAGSVESVTDTPPNFYESLSVLAVIAGATSRIKVGVAGLVLPWRDPRILAKQLTTIHEMSGRRLIPALAIGRFRDEFDVQQVPYERRGRIMDEYLECLAAILAPTPITTFAGQLIRIEGGEFFPKPTDMPLWICGMSAQALTRVARFGRGWLPGGWTAEEYRKSADTLRTALQQVGRAVDEVERGIEIFTCISERDAVAHQIAARSLRHQWGDVDEGTRRSLIGDSARALEAVHAYVAAGVTHFELKFICHDGVMMREMIEHYAAEVIPHVRTAADQ